MSQLSSAGQRVVADWREVINEYLLCYKPPLSLLFDNSCEFTLDTSACPVMLISCHLADVSHVMRQMFSQNNSFYPDKHFPQPGGTVPGFH